MLPAEMSKYFVKRDRPVITLRDELLGKDCVRHLTVIQHHLYTGNVHSTSCPSGDAAGGAAVAMTGWLVTQSHPGIWLFCWLGSSLGRVFFRAHHLLDVTLGSLYAAIICKTVHSLVNGKDGLNWCFTATFIIHIVLTIVYLKY